MLRNFFAIFCLLFSSLQANAEVDNWRGYVNFTVLNSFSSAKFRGVDKNEIDYTRQGHLGLQYNRSLSEDLRFTAQLIGSGSDNYEAKFDWMLLNWKVNNKLTVLLGKQKYPLYMLSDRLSVGYTYTTLLPSITVYGAEPLRNFNGFLIEYDFLKGSSTLNQLILELYAGNASVFTQSAGRFDGEDIIFEMKGDLKYLHGANIIFRSEKSLARLAYSRLKSEVDIILDTVSAPFEVSLNGVTFLSSTVTRSAIPLHGDYSFYSVGFNHQIGRHLFVESEYVSTIFEFKNSLSSTTSDPQQNYYVVLGLSLNEMDTVYTSYGKSSSDDVKNRFEYQSVGVNKLLTNNIRAKLELLRVVVMNGNEPYSDEVKSDEWMFAAGVAAIF